MKKLAIAEDSQHHSPGSDPADFPGPFITGTCILFYIFQLRVLVRFLCLPHEEEVFFFNRLWSSFGDAVLGFSLFLLQICWVSKFRGPSFAFLCRKVKEADEEKQTHSVPKPLEKWMFWGNFFVCDMISYSDLLAHMMFGLRWSYRAHGRSTFHFPLWSSSHNVCQEKNTKGTNFSETRRQPFCISTGTHCALLIWY